MQKLVVINKGKRYIVNVPSYDYGGGGGNSDVDSTSLLAWWKLDDGSGTTVADSSGNNNTGSFVNSSLNWTTGHIGGALAFSGSVGTYVNTNDFSDNIGALSVSAWVKPNSTMVLNGIVTKKVIGPLYSWQLSIEATSKVMYRIYTDTATFADCTSTTSITDTSKWYHVCGVYNGSTVTLYMDGVQEGTPGSLTGNINNTSATVRLGWIYDNGRELDGILDDVRIYGRALTPAEVTILASM